MTTPNDQGEVTPQETPVEQQSTVEPSYADTFLKDVPEVERPIVEKYVKQWDAGVTKRFQDVHSEYADWKPFKEAGISPDELNSAWAVANALDNNPQETLQLIAQHYGIEVAQAVADQQQAAEQGGLQDPQTPTGNDAFFSDPRFAQVQELAQTAAQILLQEQEQKQQAQEDAALEQELKNLHEKHGDFDENWVLPRAMQIGDLNKAVEEYNNLVNSILTNNNRPSAPVVLGSGGGLPATGIDPTKLNDKETKNLVTQILNDAAKERA